MKVTKRLFDIDDELLARAQRLMGVDTMTEAVREALRRVVERDPGDEYVKVLALLEPVAKRDMWSPDS